MIFFMHATNQLNLIRIFTQQNTMKSPRIRFRHSDPHVVVTHNETHAYFAGQKRSILLDADVLSFFDGVDVISVGGVRADSMLFLLKKHLNLGIDKRLFTAL